jgi:hypothetical protein
MDFHTETIQRGVLRDCQSSVLAQVKSLSPNDRFVIVLRSPDGADETGLRVCRPEKKAATLDC